MKKNRQDLLGILPGDYQETLGLLKERIRKAQYKAFKAVNRELIALYWDIGKTIVEKQEGDPGSWGKSVVERLSSDLRREFSGTRGFSASNLWRMRNFYRNYRTNEKLAALSREIGWANNCTIIEKCGNDLEREFYLRMTERNKWPNRVLITMIGNQTFERTILNQNNFNSTMPEEIRLEAQVTMKDEYHFEFLEMGEDHSERQLERAILTNLPAFLREMGGVFTYAGNQYRIEVNEKEYFIDLLLFHRRLRCLVAIDLKVTPFKPEYVGKMLFYLTALEEHVMEELENPPIGIILCKTKDRTEVEYTIKKALSPIGVAQYQTMRELPEDLRPLLPVPEQIERLLDDIG